HELHDRGDGRRIIGTTLETRHGIAASLRFAWKGDVLRVDPTGPVPGRERLAEQPHQEAESVQIPGGKACSLVERVHRHVLSNRQAFSLVSRRDAESAERTPVFSPRSLRLGAKR